MVAIVTNTKIVILVIPPILYGLNFLMPPLVVLLFLSPPFPLILPHPFKVFFFSSWSSFSSLSSFPLTNPFSHKRRLGSGEGLLPPRVEEVRMDRVSESPLDWPFHAAGDIYIIFLVNGQVRRPLCFVTPSPQGGLACSSEQKACVLHHQLLSKHFLSLPSVTWWN